MTFLRNALPSLAFVGVLFLAGTTVARANDNCQKRIAKADHKLHEAVEHHGWQSSQADHWRHELAEARAYCWDHGHRWWNEDDHRWHTERDWDEHDHDHDRDHH